MEILVVCGGVSGEREVSLRSGERVYQALCKEGYAAEFVRTDTALPDAQLLARACATDAVFLCFHGGMGEDGGWQAVLEAAGVRHYTGSGPKASALAMDKPRAKACVAALGVPVAEGKVWKKGMPCPTLPFPFAVKPCKGGSSVGFSIIRGREELENLTPSEDMLCEAYLPGREFSVAVLEGRALPPIEIRPVGGVYDYAHKYEVGAAEEICPAPLTTAELVRLQNLALVSFFALGLRDFARVDFKEDAQGMPCFLEANTLPGMTQTSLFPLAARTAGIPEAKLFAKMAAIATARKGIG